MTDKLCNYIRSAVKAYKEKRSNCMYSEQKSLKIRLIKCDEFIQRITWSCKTRVEWADSKECNQTLKTSLCLRASRDQMHSWPKYTMLCSPVFSFCPPVFHHSTDWRRSPEALFSHTKAAKALIAQSDFQDLNGMLHKTYFSVHVALFVLSIRFITAEQCYWFKLHISSVYIPFYGSTNLSSNIDLFCGY